MVATVKLSKWWFQLHSNKIFRHGSVCIAQSLVFCVFLYIIVFSFVQAYLQVSTYHNTRDDLCSIFVLYGQGACSSGSTIEFYTPIHICMYHSCGEASPECESIEQKLKQVWIHQRVVRSCSWKWHSTQQYSAGTGYTPGAHEFTPDL
jgi:hypothetical protein